MPRFSQWKSRAEMMVPPMPWDRPRWRDRGGPVVVLLHGLWRGFHAMEPLARELDAGGFSTLNLPYPSTRMPIPTIVEIVRSEVESVARNRPVHFITHSLGGIVLRSLLTESPSWEPGRLVMLAPPNQGSEIVDWAKGHPLIHRFLGPAGRTLGSDGIPGSLPALPPDIDAAVIMGNRSLIGFFRTLLDSDNDGIVSAPKGRIEGLKGFTVVDADHTFIQVHPEVIRLSMEFLRSGVWLAEPSATGPEVFSGTARHAAS